MRVFGKTQFGRFSIFENFPKSRMRGFSISKNWK
jgi:hypothetical protein